MKKKEKLNVFVCPAHKAVIVGYNRGHAVKQLGKLLRERGDLLTKGEEVTQIELEQAQVLFMEEK